MTAEELKHHVIEQAKATYRADGCDMTFDHCLMRAAEGLVHPPFGWWVGERNLLWGLDVWIDASAATDTGDQI